MKKSTNGFSSVFAQQKILFDYFQKTIGVIVYMAKSIPETSNLEVY